MGKLRLDSNGLRRHLSMGQKMESHAYRQMGLWDLMGLADCGSETEQGVVQAAGEHCWVRQRGFPVGDDEVSSCLEQDV